MAVRSTRAACGRPSANAAAGFAIAIWPSCSTTFASRDSVTTIPRVSSAYCALRTAALSSDWRAVRCRRRSSTTAPSSRNSSGSVGSSMRASPEYGAPSAAQVALRLHVVDHSRDRRAHQPGEHDPESDADQDRDDAGEHATRRWRPRSPAGSACRGPRSPRRRLRRRRPTAGRPGRSARPASKRSRTIGRPRSHVLTLEVGRHVAGGLDRGGRVTRHGVDTVPLGLAEEPDGGHVADGHVASSAANGRAVDERRPSARWRSSPRRRRTEKPRPASAGSRRPHRGRREKSTVPVASRTTTACAPVSATSRRRVVRGERVRVPGLRLGAEARVRAVPFDPRAQVTALELEERLEAADVNECAVARPCLHLSEDQQRADRDRRERGREREEDDRQHQSPAQGLGQEASQRTSVWVLSGAPGTCWTPNPCVGAARTAAAPREDRRPSYGIVGREASPRDGRRVVTGRGDERSPPSRCR